MAADRTPNELADALDRLADGATLGLFPTQNYERGAGVLLDAAAVLRRQDEQLDIQTALATNYAGKAVEYKQEKERAEEQLDTLRNAIDDLDRFLLGSSRGDERFRLRRIADAVDALAAAGGGVSEPCPTCLGRKDDGKGAQVVEVSGREVLAILKCLDCDGTGIAAGGGVPEEGAQTGRRRMVAGGYDWPELVVQFPEEGATDE